MFLRGFRAETNVSLRTGCASWNRFDEASKREEESMMNSRLGWMRDPSLHLIALTTIGAVLALSSLRGRTSPTERIGHPPGCHACSVCPPQAAAARDAFLIQTGSILPPGEVE
jgi:hypothetical protein